MRLRRRVIGFIRKLIFGTLLIASAGLGIYLGLSLPRLLGNTGIKPIFLELVGIGVVGVIVIIVIALLETTEHL